jgi:hypothetical protein
LDSKKTTTCMLCNSDIQSGEPRFYFPVLPLGHPLADLKGMLHITCLKEIDDQRKVGETLASIVEDMAKRSKNAPLITRQGNVVLRDRHDEQRVEVQDFEDFCEFSIPRSSIARLRLAKPGESIALGMQILHVKEDEKLDLEYKIPHSILRLDALPFDRLLNLLD